MAQRGLAVAFALALFIEEIRTDRQHLRALQQAPNLQPGMLRLNVCPPLRWTFSARLLVFRKGLRSSLLLDCGRAVVDLLQEGLDVQSQETIQFLMSCKQRKVIGS